MPASRGGLIMRTYKVPVQKLISDKEWGNEKYNLPLFVEMISYYILLYQQYSRKRRIMRLILVIRFFFRFLDAVTQSYYNKNSLK